MTPGELQELRDWAARKKGWYLETNMVEFRTWKGCTGYFDKDGLVMYQKHWLPDRPESGQIWMVVERMRELGWHMKLYASPDMNKNLPKHKGYGCFFERKTKSHWALDQTNPCLAILKAARATED